MRWVRSRSVWAKAVSANGIPSKRSQTSKARWRSVSFIGLRLSAINANVPWARRSRYCSLRTSLSKCNASTPSTATRISAAHMPP
ncbi:hypothetical protein D3C84_1168870 [compost metagenome]